MCTSTTCTCKSCQTDATDIFYRSKCNATPTPLTALSIVKGMNLQAIIDILGLYLQNQENIANPTVQGQPSIQTYQQVIDYLIGLNNARVTQINQLQSQINTINNTLISLNNRLVNVEKPGVLDTNGFGFTMYSSLQTVLQKINDNI